jgi:hypothetical protein
MKAVRAAVVGSLLCLSANVIAQGPASPAVPPPSPQVARPMLPKGMQYAMTRTEQLAGEHITELENKAKEDETRAKHERQLWAQRMCQDRSIPLPLCFVDEDAAVVVYRDLAPPSPPSPKTEAPAATGTPTYDDRGVGPAPVKPAPAK